MSQDSSINIVGVCIVPNLLDSNMHHTKSTILKSWVQKVPSNELYVCRQMSNKLLLLRPGYRQNWVDKKKINRKKKTPLKSLLLIFLQADTGMIRQKQMSINVLRKLKTQ